MPNPPAIKPFRVRKSGTREITLMELSTGMQGWLRELDHHLPMLCGEDGPFRDCAPADERSGARHTPAPVATAQPAPSSWWDWWN